MPKYKNDEYDISAAFRAIEDELIASMIRNLKQHRADETLEGIEWSQWQVEQLRSLEKYRRENAGKFGKQFNSINAQIDELIRMQRAAGNSAQEVAILNAIKKGFSASRISSGATAEFFRLNDRKLEALIKATVSDMQRAETAVLRMANDQYRKVIFNAQVYANSGAGTYEAAVDMATKDMLAAGLNCVQYANGARHTLKDYAHMAIQTASKRAYLQGEGEKRQEWGISTVIMNKRGNPCPKCLPFVGKVLVDDVWSGGKASDGPYQLMSTAVAAGLYHPRCQDSHTTYFEGVSTPPDDVFSRQELGSIKKSNRQEAKMQYARRQAERFGRLAGYSLDENNKKKYREREITWKEQSTRGRIPDTAMNRPFVESAEYKRRIDSLSEESSVKRTIWQEMVSSIRHRNGSKYEDLIFVDSITGQMRRSVNFERESTASPTAAMRKMLKNADEGTLIAIHNHPGSTVPSWNDIIIAAKRKYKYGLIACHDGSIFKYEIESEPVELFYLPAVAKLDKAGYNKDSLKEFCEAVKDSGVKMEVL